MSPVIKLEVPDPITRGLKPTYYLLSMHLFHPWSAWPDYKGIETTNGLHGGFISYMLEVPDPITRGLKLWHIVFIINIHIILKCLTRLQGDWNSVVITITFPFVSTWSAWPDYKGIETCNAYYAHWKVLCLKCLTRLQGDWNYCSYVIPFAAAAWSACPDYKGIETTSHIIK